MMNPTQQEPTACINVWSDEELNLFCKNMSTRAEQFGQDAADADLALGAFSGRRFKRLYFIGIPQAIFKGPIDLGGEKDDDNNWTTTFHDGIDGTICIRLEFYPEEPSDEDND